jgi:hypothetical protein
LYTTNGAGAEVSKCLCTRRQVSKNNSLSSAIIINCVALHSQIYVPSPL